MLIPALIETDRWDNYWLSKPRTTNKIEGAAMAGAPTNPKPQIILL